MRPGKSFRCFAAAHNQLARVLSLLLVMVLFAGSKEMALSSVATPSPTVISPGVWTSNGPYGGRVVKLAASPEFRTDHTLFAATGGGIFKSTDGGASWQAMTQAPGAPISTLYVSPTYRTDETVWAGTGGGGLWVSRDGGVHWERVEGTNLDARAHILEIAVSPRYRRDSTLFVSVGSSAADSGQPAVLRSENGGATWWRVLSSPLASVAFPALAISPGYNLRDRVIFAGSSNGLLFKSSDGGDNWDQIALYAGPDPFQIRSIALSPDYTDDDTLFVATSGPDAGSSGLGVLRSTDDGASWDQVLPFEQPFFGSPSLVISPAENWSDDTVLAAFPEVGALFLSTNRGDTWTSAGDGLGNAVVEALCMAPDYRGGGFVWAGTRGDGVFLWNVGVARAWRPSNRGLSAYHVPAIAVSSLFSIDHFILAGSPSGGVFRSDDSGRTWQPANLGLPFQDRSVYALALSPYRLSTLGVLLAGSPGGRVFRSDRNIISWTLVYTVPGGAAVEDLAISPGFVNDGTCFLAAGPGGLHKSTDFGLHWEPLPLEVDIPLHALAIAPPGNATGITGRSTLFAGGGSGLILRSQDGGAHWQTLTTGLSDTSVVVELAVSPNYAEDRTVFAGYTGSPGGVIRTQDGGESWHSMEGLPDDSVYAIAFRQRSAGDPAVEAVYVGTRSHGVFRSRDGGETWDEFNNHLDAPWIAALAVAPVSTEVVFAGTWGRGVWTYLAGTIPTLSPTPTAFVETATFTPTQTASATSSPSATTTPSATATATITRTPKPTSTATPTETQFSTASPTPTFSVTLTETPYTTGTPTVTGSATATLSPTPSHTATNTFTVTATASATSTATGTFTSTLSPLPTDTATHTPSHTTAWTQTATTTPSATGMLRLPLLHRMYPKPWLRSGLANTPIKSLAADPGNMQVVYTGASSGGFRHLYCGGGWLPTSLPSVGIYAFAIAPPPIGHIFVGTWGHGVYRSIDGGITWQLANEGLDSPYVNAAAVSPNYAVDRTVYVGTDTHGVYKSTNDGDFWQPCNSGLTSVVVLSLSVNPAEPQVVLAGTYDQGVFRSTNGGQSWVSVPIGNDVVWALATSPSNPQIVYAGTNGGVFRSDSRGEYWMPTGFWGGKTFSLVIHPSDEKYVFAGTDGSGVFWTRNGGSTWKTINKGLGNRRVQALALDLEDCGLLYAGTDDGIWERTVP